MRFSKVYVFIYPTVVVPAPSTFLAIQRVKVFACLWHWELQLTEPTASVTELLESFQLQVIVAAGSERITFYEYKVHIFQF